MSDPTAPAPQQHRSSWPKAVTIIVVAALFAGVVVYGLRTIGKMPGAAIEKSTALVSAIGGEAAKVARAFSVKTVREEFVSRATELAGTSRFQFASLRQEETFQRTETGSTAWGLVPLPTVVVGARGPVDYTYYVDFAGQWEFSSTDSDITVYPPAIAANPPALDVSALQFYTLEGGVWRNDSGARERLRESLSAALVERAAKNAGLVREVGRKRLAEFVEKWLAEKFSDGARMRVKVVFPDERPISPEQKKAPEAGRE